ncbi:hypothetical protein F5Y15DRAFT_97028 [Xylariaceae sp. FL0016]|nr:hypothetical protein F5Y15DRAFT_97028 [Xylariaceae sp. FL0016]
MTSVFGLIRRNWQALYSPPIATKSDNALKFGVLGAANIGPLALFTPAISHPEVIVQAVAARDVKKAQDYAKKHGIPDVKGSYQDLIDDPSIDCVYIPLPNGLHYEWTIRALRAGKHVLLEKPSVSNAKEAEALFNLPLLREPNAPVLLEAFHYQFQPSWAVLLSLVDRRNLAHVHAFFKIPSWTFDDNDIRFEYDLAGGSIMDLGTYTISALRHVIGAEAEACLECNVVKMAEPKDKCDHTFDAKFRFPNGVTGDIEGGHRGAPFPIKTPYVTVTHREVPVADANVAEGQETTRVRKVTLWNYLFSPIWHRIDVEDTFTIFKTSDKSVVKTWATNESRKAYTFKEGGIDQPSEDYWMSYRHQMEQFVNKVKGRKVDHWVTSEDSIAQMRMIDMAYEKSGLGIRPSTDFK